MSQITKLFIRNHFIQKFTTKQIYGLTQNRLYCEVKSNATEQDKDSKLGGFAKAFEKHLSPIEDKPATSNETFASLLKSSRFIDVNL